MALSNESSWQKDSLCQDYPNLDFFPSESETANVKKVKKVCSDCLVKQECLNYALDTKQPDGIWGGFTTTERKRVGPMRNLILMQPDSPVVIKNTSIKAPKTFSLKIAKSFSLYDH